MLQMNLKNRESWENRMSRLSEVTEEMAVKLLSEVEFNKHLKGTKFHAMSGGLPVFMTKLEEVKNFLQAGSMESLLTLGGGGIINYLDWLKLKNWVADVFGDQELADAIGEEIEKGHSYINTIVPMRELVEERLQQCKDLLQKNESEKTEPVSIP